MTAPFDTRLIDTIVATAQRGWMPRDLFHIFGDAIHPLLYRAAPRIPPLVASPTVRQAWLMLPPPADPYYSPQQARAWLDELVTLPRLRDARFLSTSSAENSRPDDPDSKVRRKIEALLRKAESTQFEEEAQALTARAQALRQKHRIAESSLDDAAATARRAYVTGPYVKHKFTLLTAIARENGATGVLMDARGIACLFGAPDDLDHILDLYASLARQGEYFMHNSEGAELARIMRQTASFRRSFWLAYAAEVGALLHAANAGDSGNASEADDDADTDTSRDPADSAASDSTPGAGLELLQRRTDLAETAMSEVFPHLRSMSLSAHNNLGLAAGVSAAESAHFRGDGAGVGPARLALPA